MSSAKTKISCKHTDKPAGRKGTNCSVLVFCILILELNLVKQRLLRRELGSLIYNMQSSARETKLLGRDCKRFYAYVYYI